MFAAILISFGVVVVAELGDKSQLIAMTYTLRHRWWVILSGVGIAAAMVHGVSVTIGHFLGLTLPARSIAVVAAIAFFMFAAWTLREMRVENTVPATAPNHRFVLLAVISSFVLAELGDKTMLATVALASDHHWAGVWIGATAAMVVADGIAIGVGALLHRRLPMRFLQGLAGVLFGLLGLWLLLDVAMGWRAVAVVVTAVTAAAAVCIYTRGVRHGTNEAVPVAPASASDRV